MRAPKCKVSFPARQFGFLLIFHPVQVGASLLRRLGSPGKVELEHDGDESEGFWEAFENG